MGLRAIRLRTIPFRLSSSSTSSPTCVVSTQSSFPSSQPDIGIHEVKDNNSELSDTSNADHPLFRRQSKRRLLASPTLPLEAVAISQPIQTELSKYVKSLELRSRQYTASYSYFHNTRARETYRFVGQRIKKHYTPVIIAPPNPYSRNQVGAYAANRFPGTFASCVHILSEIRRILPSSWTPSSVLDYGCGIGTALMAVTRTFTCPSISDHCSLKLLSVDDQSEGDLKEEWDGAGVLLGPEHSSIKDNIKIPHMPVNHAWLVDHSPEMINLAKNVLKKDINLSNSIKDLMFTSSLSQGPPRHRRYDLVIASYSISEIIKETMIHPRNNDDDKNTIVNNEDNADDYNIDVSTKKKILLSDKERIAEMRGKKLIRSLWRRTKPGGILIIIEDGTASGFETVLFAREFILSKNDRTNSSEMNSLIEEQDEVHDGKNAESMENVRARIIAPCIHSKKCPLDGTVTRHRICRFVQRLNRPPLQRETYPRHNAFEDEFFSYVAIQKVQTSNDLVNQDVVQKDIEEIYGDQWGRLIRAPLKRRQHITMDACTGEARLERRVVSKANAPKGDFPIARRTRWGDVWPRPPSSKCSDVNF